METTAPINSGILPGVAGDVRMAVLGDILINLFAGLLADFSSPGGMIAISISISLGLTSM
jgi:hypothetical protein